MALKSTDRPSNVVQGNKIGVSADGLTNLGTGSDGIWIHNGANNNIIGGIGSAGNWIAGSGVVGIEVFGPADGTVIQGNRIGTDASGTLNWGTDQNAVLLGGGATNSLIGGTTAGEGNIVAFSGNGGTFTDGIEAYGNTTTGNAILGNSIYSNQGLAITLDGGATPSTNDGGDADNGANNLQNYPVLFLADINTNTTDVRAR